MDLGVHLPLLQFAQEPLSLRRLRTVVDAARECGFAAISANDHFLFQAPWLDGPTALASVIERSAPLTLATTVTLPVLRGPVALAKALTAIDVLSEGRLIAAVGPGSSARDYEAVGIPFEERWGRFDEALVALRSLLTRTRPSREARYYDLPPNIELLPEPVQQQGVPLWVGSWGSPAGLARVARSGDGWLASAYNATPEQFATAREALTRELVAQGRDAEAFPNAVATMWTWVAKNRADGDRMLTEVLAPLLNRDPSEIGDRVCVGPVEHCAELLSSYAEAGCERVYLWPLGDERRQLELVASEVAPMFTN